MWFLFIINNVCGGIFCFVISVLCFRFRSFSFVFWIWCFLARSKERWVGSRAGEASPLPGRGRFCGFASAKVRAFFVQVIIKTSFILITSYKFVRNIMILFKIERFDKIILRKIRRKSTHFLLFSKKSAPTFLPRITRIIRMITIYEWLQDAARITRMALGWKISRIWSAGNCKKCPLKKRSFQRTLCVC